MMVPPTPVPARRVSVYEFVNVARRESLLVISAESDSALLERLRRSPPPEAQRWTRLDGLIIEQLAEPMAASVAEEFMRRYQESMAGRTWRFHVWRP